MWHSAVSMLHRKYDVLRGVADCMVSAHKKVYQREDRFVRISRSWSKIESSLISLVIAVYGIFMDIFIDFMEFGVEKA